MRKSRDHQREAGGMTSFCIDFSPFFINHENLQKLTIFSGQVEVKGNNVFEPYGSLFNEEDAITCHMGSKDNYVAKKKGPHWSPGPVCLLPEQPASKQPFSSFFVYLQRL